jgi:hypothetical protein
MERLRNLDKTHGKRIIPFPVIFYDLGMFYHMTRGETKIIIQDLREQGCISFHPFNGIKVLNNGDERIDKNGNSKT